MSKPEIYDYLNYRDYLKDYYSYRKNGNSHFSYRTFSDEAGLKSRSFFKLVIENKRNLTQNTISNAAKVCGLQGRELKYFTILVDYSHEKDLQKQTEFLKELHKLARRVGLKEIVGEQNLLLSKWYYSVVRTLVNLPDFEANPEFISNRIRNFISQDEAREALLVLQELGIIKEINGKFTLVEKHLTANNETITDNIRDLHLQILELGKRVIMTLPKDERKCMSMTVDISRAGVGLIKAKVDKFYQDLRYLVEKDTNSEAICQINLQLLNLTNEVEQKV